MFSLQLKNLTQAHLDSVILESGKEQILAKEILIDTGFDGELAIPKEAAELLNIVSTDFEFQKMEFADSKGVLRKSKVTMYFQEIKFNLNVIWLENSDEPLIGSGFFAKYADMLQFNYKENTVSILLK